MENLKHKTRENPVIFKPAALKMKNKPPMPHLMPDADRRRKLYSDDKALRKALLKACEDIFKGRTWLPYQDHIKNTRLNYEHIDLDKYASQHSFVDAIYQGIFMKRARNQVDQIINPDRKPDDSKILIVGAGTGRLAPVDITLAQKLNIGHIYFNDLIGTHLEKTREKIKGIYGTDGYSADNVQLHYLHGDILKGPFKLEENPDQKKVTNVDFSYFKDFFEAIYLWWFVDSELFDGQESNALQQSRYDLFRNFRDITTAGGALVIDSPDPNLDPGAYNKATKVTEEILKEHKILPGQERNLMLINYEAETGETSTSQLKYTPRNGKGRSEKENSGWEYNWSIAVPLPIKSGLKPNSELADKGVEMAANMYKQHGTIDNALSVMEMMKLSDVQDPLLGDIAAQGRQITLWKSNKPKNSSSHSTNFKPANSPTIS